MVPEREKEREISRYLIHLISFFSSGWGRTGVALFSVSVECELMGGSMTERRVLYDHILRCPHRRAAFSLINRCSHLICHLHASEAFSYGERDDEGSEMNSRKEWVMILSPTERLDPNYRLKLSQGLEATDLFNFHAFTSQLLIDELLAAYQTWTYNPKNWKRKRKTGNGVGSDNGRMGKRIRLQPTNASCV